jgi:hypothetical protein
LTAIRVIENLISKKDLLQKQQSFVQYFKNRMVQMMEDKDIAVAVEAIKLVSLLAKYVSIVLFGFEEAREKRCVIFFLLKNVQTNS